MTSEQLQAAFKYLFPDEVPFLKELALSLPDNPVVVNIGAGAGTSGLAFVESRLDLQLYTIDQQKEDSPFGCLAAEEREIKKADLWYALAGNPRVRHIHQDSVEAGEMWHIFYNPADMVFVDGNHTYKGCKADIKAWLPNIKSGGIIAIHDYKKSELYEHEKDYQTDKPHPKFFKGLDRAVKELLLSKYEIIKRVDSLIAFRIK